MIEHHTETAILKSRLVASASYDTVTGYLHIKLRDGREKAFPAPRTMYESLITAQSPGWYYTRHINPTPRV